MDVLPPLDTFTRVTVKLPCFEQLAVSSRPMFEPSKLWVLVDAELIKDSDSLYQEQVEMPLLEL